MPEPIWPPLCRWYFQIHCPGLKCMCFDEHFNDFFPESIYQQDSTASYNCSAWFLTYECATCLNALTCMSSSMQQGEWSWFGIMHLWCYEERSLLVCQGYRVEKSAREKGKSPLLDTARIHSWQATVRSSPGNKPFNLLHICMKMVPDTSKVLFHLNTVIFCERTI